MHFIGVLFCALSSIIHLDCNQNVFSLCSVRVGMLGQLLAKLAAKLASLSWSRAIPQMICFSLGSMFVATFNAPSDVRDGDSVPYQKLVQTSPLAL